ncbi:MAG: hypothetical protein GTO51_09985 [Candidatus Latescibacteria bacterium]|nr:hypothetical protein [Candidatus Latescibacterota bacterium]NIM66297.1 hypothetical protein [Candidatus Latescibacterota bacterium]NIO02776.1 hypothetical protein [Candidatus Latescibacterota bacterium]NIO29911.1 hypothetical protein [Candidatus Latescibacterota bacterium]NIO57525.1 hypothetical protein [Candidatus Latescibacterota bacterium]
MKVLPGGELLGDREQAEVTLQEQFWACLEEPVFWNPNPPAGGFGTKEVHVVIS